MGWLLRRNPDHKCQCAILIACRDFPTSGGREVNPGNDELIISCPAPIRLVVALERRRGVQSLAFYDEVGLWLGARVVSFSPKKELLSERRVVRRVMW